MKKGHFDEAAREYVITDPRTPVRWINYVGGLEFGGFLDHTGGGVICSQDPALNRITRYFSILPPSQFNGETAYIREKTASGWEIFSPYWVPTLEKDASYRCRVGLGYSVYEHELRGVRCEVTAFVPQKDRVLVRRYKITNTGTRPRTLDICPVVEYSHFDALKQLTNADWVPQTVQGRAAKTASGIPFLTQYAFMHKEQRMNFFASSRPASSWQTDRQRFLGNDGWGTWARPGELENEELDDYQAERGDIVSALLVPLGTLGPGESVEFHTILSQAPTTADCAKLAEGWLKPDYPGQEFAALKAYWDQYLQTLQIESPDPAFNAMVNIFNPRQSWVTKNWSRYLSLYQLGFGSRGIGCRDTAQDILATFAFDPGGSRGLLELLLGIQNIDGSAMHQVNPLSGEASIGDAAEGENRPTYYGDDHLWLVLAAAKYLKETFDLDFLSKKIPFYQKDRSGKPVDSASVLDHLKRALDFTWGNRGSHGLPLLGYADWNDTVNLPTGAESIFNACLYGRALQEAAWIASKIGDSDLVALCEKRHTEMADILNRQAWDGEWYTRYFDEQGRPIGSHVNEKGKIYTNAQSWAVLSGLASGDRGRQALDSVRKHLYTTKGIKLSAPGYDGYDEHIGGVSTYPPGAKENGGIFLHANPWVIIAETMTGRADRAFEYYMNINPAAKNEAIGEYELEPYVFAQNILGDEHPQFGLGRNSWLSGTSSWMYQAASEYIVGVRADGDGLIVDPCIPGTWKGLTVTRKFRGKYVRIRIVNQSSEGRCVKSATLDGSALTSENGKLRIPYSALGNTSEIVAIL